MGSPIPQLDPQYQDRLARYEAELRRLQQEIVALNERAASTEAALRTSEEFNARLLACSRDCIKVLDLDGNLLSMNQGGMQELEICDLAPFVDRPWLGFWQGEDRIAATAALAAARHGEIGRFTGYFPLAVSKAPRWWDVVVSPIRNTKGEIERLLALSRDVTLQKQAEIALREACQFNEAIVAGAAQGIIVYDLELRYRVFNPFMERLTGRRASELIGRLAIDVFPRLRSSGIEAMLRRALQGEVVQADDIFVPKHAAGERDVWESCTFAPQFDPQGKVAGVIGLVQDVTERHIAEAQLKDALVEVRTLKERLQAENVYLQEEIRKEHNFEEIVGRSPALLGVLRQVETVAPTDATVLIVGETGSGKELIARALHSRSRRQNRALVKLNCGAIPTGLVESELFGHMKGAFTGALERRIGRFELADGGTLFLDEIGELPPETQVKLLRVLQEHEFEPLGSSRTIRVNVRIIAATNRDLQTAVKEGQFRADLFYRLNVLPIVLPALRQRRSDIPLLAAFFADHFSRKFGKRVTGIAQTTMDVLSRYDWPGNIRELQNVMERAVILSPGPVLRLGTDLLPLAAQGWNPDPDIAATADRSLLSLEDVEKCHILQVLNDTGWVIEGERGAARILDLHPNTLRSRMKRLGIARPSSPLSESA